MAVIMAIISARMGTNATLESMAPADLNGAIRTAFLIAIAVVLLGIAVAFTVLKSKKPDSMETSSKPLH
ncbi:hypothetical protein [Paenibacillus caui]|uniref:hypothetical protein n=1 Tax=Paenibacillus caui TaxID=2873927 RepID=UPI001F48DA63|nr:hypothetical protein [Paenibacillus caui]